MKKIFAVLIIGMLVFAACKTTDKGNRAPLLGSGIEIIVPEYFSPDPDVPDYKMEVSIKPSSFVNTIKEWTIRIEPIRDPAAQGQGGQQRERPAAVGEDGQPIQRPSRGPFFEEKGEGTPPAKWYWDGNSSREPRPGRERDRVQSAGRYELTLIVTDFSGESTEYKHEIDVDVLVRRDENGDLRMIVSDITFPPSSADFSLLGEQEMRSNRRVLNLVGRALNKYSDYAVTIEGHANPTTAPNTPARTQEQVGDLRLSQQRAQAVADYLAANQNIDKSRLNVVGIGNARTIAPYDDPDENWKNRRVEFILHK